MNNLQIFRKHHFLANGLLNFEMCIWIHEKKLHQSHYTHFEIQELLSFTCKCPNQPFHSEAIFKNSLTFLPWDPFYYADIYMHYFESTLFDKFSFPFWTHYVDDIFILIDTFLHNINNVINVMNSVSSSIQFTS